MKMSSCFTRKGKRGRARLALRALPPPLVVAGGARQGPPPSSSPGASAPLLLDVRRVVSFVILLVLSPLSTIGTLCPAWIWYLPMLWPLRLRMLLTGYTVPPIVTSRDSIVSWISAPTSHSLTSIPAARMPASVAALTAAKRSSNCGSNATVQAQSMMRPSILSAEVDLHHVAVLQDRAVAAVRRVVRRDVIDGAAGGEPYAPREARLLHQLAVLVLEQVAHVDELDAGRA